MNRLIFSSPFNTRLACLVFMLIISLPSFAEAPRWYEVELALISYQDDQKFDDENWSGILEAESSNILGSDDILVSDSALTMADPWAWLNWWNQDNNTEGLFNVQKGEPSNKQPPLEIPFKESGLAFERDVARFERAKELTIVWNKKWRQPIPDEKDALLNENQIHIDVKTALNTNAPKNSKTPLSEIEITGNLYLYRSRYLHLVSNLKVQHWQNLEDQHTLDQAINILPSNEEHKSSIATAKNSTPLTTITEIPLRAALIKQSRRMRSSELHYIDHPMLGILIRVIPLAE